MLLFRALRARLAQGPAVDPRPALRGHIVVPLDAADPRPSRLNDRRFDGQLTARDGLFPPGLALSRLGDESPAGLPKIRAFVPADGRPPRELLLQVNGIMTDVALHQANLQDIADRTGCAVVGVHNSTTHDMALDVKECVDNKLDRNDHMPAVGTLAALTLDALDDRLPIRLLGHSQGALVLEGTLQCVIAVRRAHHLAAGLTDKQADLAVLQDLKLISIETWGGASHCFSGGTTDDMHLVNLYDMVARLLGVGSEKHALSNVEVGRVSFRHWGKIDWRGLVRTVCAHGLRWGAARAVDMTSHGPGIYAEHRPARPPHGALVLRSISGARDPV